MQYDTNKDGVLDPMEIDAAMYSLGVATTTKEAADILATFDYDRSGRCELAEFRMLVEKVRQFKAAPAPPPPLAQGVPVAAEIHKPREIVATGETVGTVFRRFDVDNSGELDIAELKQALNALGLDADTAGAADVLAKYDTDGNGRIDLKEFRPLVKELRAFQEQQGGVITAPAVPTVPAVSTNAQIDAVFDEFDRDGSKDIDVQELRQALNRLGLPVDTAAASEVLEQYSQTGRLNRDQFRKCVMSVTTIHQATGVGQAMVGD